MGFFKSTKYCALFLAIVLFIVSAEENAQIFLDRASLVSLMSFVDLVTENPLGSWNSSSVHVCNWSGIVCNENMDHVIELVLSGHHLRGTISPALGKLSFLTILDLSGNFFHGRIPAELGSLSQLKQLSLSSNLLEGNIPPELGQLNQLVYLNLGSNRLVGQIPVPLFCNLSSSLEYMDLSNNSLSGEIPVKNQCQLRELRFLLLWSNQLVGQVPLSLSNSSKLEWLELESNSLSGDLPSEIVNHMPKLRFLYLSFNDFVSHDGNTNLHRFFSSLANASNLQEIELAGNNLGGEIPPTIGDLSTNIVQIHLDDNLICGPIPPEISNLANLTLLNLSSNLLNGSIPPELHKAGNLERLYLSNNSLSGNIPSTLGSIPHLGLLDVSKNKLSGSIPDSFANLPQLRRLLLYENQLSGKIPQSLGNCINLEILDLSHNQILGEIPSEVARLSSLKLYLNLSNNHLSGSIPLELGKMDMVLAIDLSVNNLNGSLPSQVSSCIALEYLNLSGNRLEGPLPKKIGQLPYLQVLDLSMNHLVGQIPESFQEPSNLKELNFSFNNFSGNVPNKGSFSNLTIDSFRGNHDLCGTIKGMRNCQKRTPHHFRGLATLLSIFSAPILFIFGYVLVVFSSRNRGTTKHYFNGEEMEGQRQERKEPKYPRISHRQLIGATGGFNFLGLIGSGRFGHVYEGTLRNNMRIAVKVLDSRATREASGSFKRECQALKRIRHRNLIRIITVCNKPDFKAIVFPLMSKGSLEKHLYPSHGMDLVQLISICTDVAEGMAYLHHHSTVRVVHCDLKPSNILLDDDMNALITDFGISRLIKGGDGGISANDSTSFKSTDDLLCGSLGYIAPEYGLGKRASTQGDVYSFGILLLEIVTRKRPTDVLSHEGSSLHEWVKSHYPHNLEPIVEQALLRCAPRGITSTTDRIWGDVILELIELGLMCSQSSPSTRPSMLDITHELGKLKQHISDCSSLLPEENPAKY
ncbi:hypothetical protein Nepgr_005392 [Nepenthes gracilis]|uniref:non-specific serine/threonine protein kinase n=1 Tax=Nepenthes gracilis TaxID=150966 RepID=A0AAD3XGE3_NEPGR|nr:hypothetical protein Nepgr_005392 [Nepenthes gracilis]